MLSGVRFRAYPAESQKPKLRLWIGHQRFIKNSKVREADYWDTFGRRNLSLTGQVPFPDQAYSQFVGPDTQWLRDVPSQVLRIGAYRFATASVRACKGLGGKPTTRGKWGRQSVLLTSELFQFVEKVNPATGEISHDLFIGTDKHPIGRLRFKAHCPYEIPKMLSVSIEPSGEWYVSFCYEVQAVADAEPVVLRTPQELAYEFGQRPDLAQLVEGFDRGVAKAVASSNGQMFDIPEVCSARIARKQRPIKRLQCKLSRQDFKKPSQDPHVPGEAAPIWARGSQGLRPQDEPRNRRVLGASVFV